MSDVPPPSLLITPDKRRRLQQRYEEAMRLAAWPKCDRAAVHEILAECVWDDPGSTLYLDALFANLRQWQPKPERSWLSGWFGGAKANASSDAVAGTQNSVLSNAPSLLRDRLGDVTVLCQLAEAAAACDLDDIELRYLTEARRIAPDDVTTLRQLARCLTRQGRFEEALGPWFAVLAPAPDAEATSAIEDLRPLDSQQHLSSQLGPITPEEIEGSLQLGRELRAQGLPGQAGPYYVMAKIATIGANIVLFTEREELLLEHSRLRIAIARQRAQSDPHPKAQSLVGRMDQEHNRLEIDIFHLRSERHPHDQRLKLELARRLKRAGNYSGAIQRLEEALADAALASEVNLELGECWQHLRQFGKALVYYRQAAECSSAGDHRATLLAALYRIGVLAAAMNEPAEARAALTQLMAIEPAYKDARERLDKLP